MQNRDLDYFRNLDYAVIITRFRDGDTVYFRAVTRELNQDVFYGIGDTLQEAVTELENAKTEMFAYYIANGIPIPEPRPESDNLPSGNFVTRTSPLTHKKLIELAKANRQSLNATINKILSEYVTSESLIEAASSRLGEIMRGTGLQRIIVNPVLTWSASGNYEVYVCQSPTAEVTDLTKYNKQNDCDVAAS
jgi:predicted HicB family RNase H-like nuclease